MASVVDRPGYELDTSAASGRTGSACAQDGGPVRAPAGWLTRCWEATRESAWAPVAGRALGIGLMMAGLAGVGAASIAAGSELVAGAGRAIDAGPVSSSSRERAFISAGAARAIPSSSSGAPAPPAGSGIQPGLTPEGKVILNRASAEELMRLPGIGKKRAEAIIALRSRLGGFRRPSDLIRIRGIGPKRLRRLLPELVLDPPPTAAPEPAPRTLAAQSQ